MPCACSASSTIDDAGIDGAFDGHVDLDAADASDATDAGEVDAFDGEVVAPACAPLLAVDAVPARDEAKEHWLDRLDVIAPRTLDPETRTSLESEGVLECRRAAAGDEAPVFYRLRLPRARELASLRAFAVELSSVVGIDWGMPDLRWAPGIGAVGWLDPTQPELAVTVTRGLR